LEETLQRDIDLLRSKVSEMGRLSGRALGASVSALVEGDRRLAYSVILRDQYIDELETELDRLCLEFLVRHQPAGAHLRFVYTTIQINKEIERIGDYAESIARQALHLTNLEVRPQLDRFIELGNVATQILRDAVQAFLKQDAELAWRTMALEEQANSLRNTINAEVAELSRKSLIPAAAVTPLLTVARRLERWNGPPTRRRTAVRTCCTCAPVNSSSTSTGKVFEFSSWTGPMPAWAKWPKSSAVR